MTHHTVPPVRFFGRRWNAPAFEGAVQVPVPLGATCLLCGELGDEDDSGLLQAAILSDGTPGERAIHIECHLRTVMGGLAHLEHRCSCYGGPDHEPHTRDDARAVMTWLIAEQTRRGLPNPGFVDDRHR